MEEEPKEQDPAELFPAFGKLSEIGREVGDAVSRAAFVEAVVSSGEINESTLALSSAFLESVKANSRSAVEAAVDPDLKHDLQIREQLDHQIALIILLLDTMCAAEGAGNEQLADELFIEARSRIGELSDEMESVLADENLTHIEYFEAIQEKVSGMLG